MITEEDAGSTVSLAMGQPVSVRLDSDWAWDVTNVTGTAIELVKVDYAVDPGFFEWEIQPREAGDATVEFHGSPNCADLAACPERDAEFEFVVGG
jgi:hypothetical protein